MSKKQNSSDTKAGYYGYSSETTSAANHAHERPCGTPDAHADTGSL